MSSLAFITTRELRLWNVNNVPRIKLLKWQKGNLDVWLYPTTLKTDDLFPCFPFIFGTLACSVRTGINRHPPHKLICYLPQCFLPRIACMSLCTCSTASVTTSSLQPPPSSSSSTRRTSSRRKLRKSTSVFVFQSMMVGVECCRQEWWARLIPEG